MAVKSILDVEINDGKFLAFKKLYDQYSASLKSMPAAWKLVNDKIDGTRSSFDKIVDKMVAQNVQAKLHERAQERADKLTQTQAERWAGMARSAKGFAGSVKDATVSLLKWGSIAGVISGLAGAGGLFGIDRLALGVGASRRSALGQNLGYGDAKAFSANFSRLVDPDSFLAGVSAAKTDVTRRVGLIGAGLTPGEIGGGNADTAVALLKRLKTIADTTNPALFAQTIQSRRLDQFVTPEDLQRLRGTSREEFAGLVGRYGKNRGDFDLPADVSRKWQDFATAMTRAGQGIENTFVRGLAPLTPGLEKLSESVEKVVRSFLANPALGEWVKKVGDALERFAGYIGTPEFQHNVESLASGIAGLAKAVADAIAWIAGKAPVASAAAGGFKTGLAHSPAAYGYAGLARLWGLESRAIAGFVGNARASGGAMTQDDLLGIVRQSERSGATAVSPKGAIGTYQITPDTARTYGLDPGRLTDAAYNEAGAKKILADLIKRYHGNTAEILAAYNAGPGRANDFRRAGGDASVLPGETQRYLARAQGMGGYKDKVEVTINDNTGGNVNTSVNGLKQ